MLAFADSLHCADLRAVFHGMKSEVDLRDGLLMVDGAQSIVNLDSVPYAIRQVGIFGVHSRELGAKRLTCFYLVIPMPRWAQ